MTLSKIGLYLCLCAVPQLLCWSPAKGQEAPEVNLTSDLTYREGANLAEAEKAACKLDIFTPQSGKNLPVLLWFHGGGLTGGDKTSRQTAALSRALASQGFVVASANYRLNPAVKFPAYVEDVAAAAAWMKQNAARYGGDGSRLFLGGHSAGAYLVALAASDPRYLEAHQLKPEHITGVVALSGQMATHFTVRQERGIPESTMLVDAAAPLGHVSQSTPPMLLIYGEKDMALRAEENLLLAAALRAAGNERVRCLAVPGRDHGGTISHMTKPDDPVRREIVAFLSGKTGP